MSQLCNSSFAGLVDLDGSSKHPNNKYKQEWNLITILFAITYWIISSNFKLINLTSRAPSSQDNLEPSHELVGSTNSPAGFDIIKVRKI